MQYICIIPPASGDRWFRVCFWSLSNLPSFSRHFQHSSFLKGGVYPSLYPSPWTKNGGVAGGRLVSFPLLADLLALHLLTFFCDPFFISFGSFLAPFWPPFGSLFGGFWRILRASVRHPIFQRFFLDFRQFFKEFSDDFLMDFRCSFTTSIQYVGEPAHAQTLACAVI